MTTNEMTWTKTTREIGMVDRTAYRLLPLHTRPDDSGDYWTVYRWNTKWLIESPAGWGRITEVFDTLRDAKEHVEHLERVHESDLAVARRAADAIAASDAAALASSIDTVSASEMQESALSHVDRAPAPDPYWNRDTRLQSLERRVSTIHQMQAGIPRMVHHARAAGASWADIGRVLGVSLQAAHKRYADHPAAPSAMREAITGVPLWDDTPAP